MPKWTLSRINQTQPMKSAALIQKPCHPMKRVSSFLLQGAALAALAVGPLIAAEPRAPERYCNPLPIPDYPVGKLARDVTKG
jgi:hypothetical protein